MDSDDEGHSFWSRPFNFGDVNLRVEELWGEGIGGTVWEGGILLSRFLSSPAFQKLGLGKGRCIELGAGVSALPSIVAAHTAGFDEVVITDIQECLEGLKANVTANLPATATLRTTSRTQETVRSDTSGWQIPATVVEAIAADQHPEPNQRTPESPEGMGASIAGQEADRATAAIEPQSAAETCPATQPHDHDRQPHGTAVRIEELDWQDDVTFLQPPYDLVLVADVVYVAELSLPLLTCMWRLCGPATVVLLAYYVRSASAHAKFWELLPGFFECQKISESDFDQTHHDGSIGLFKLSAKSREQGNAQRQVM